MEHGFYHPTAGYWQAIETPSEATRAAYPEGTVEVPLRPGDGYTYSGTNWVPPLQEWLDAKAAVSVRSERDAKLVRDVDPVASNALRWGSLSAEEQAQWAAYRTALLDITKQAGFPHTIVWPTKP